MHIILRVGWFTCYSFLSMIKSFSLDSVPIQLFIPPVLLHRCVPCLFTNLFLIPIVAHLAANIHCLLKNAAEHPHKKDLCYSIVLTSECELQTIVNYGLSECRKDSLMNSCSHPFLITVQIIVNLQVLIAGTFYTQGFFSLII